VIRTETTLPLQPCGSHLLLRLAKPRTESKGGIYLPEIMWKLPVSGVVLAVGPGRDIPETGRRSTIWSAVGDEVLFQRKDLRAIDGDDEHALLLAEDVLGFVSRNGTVCPENDWVLVELDATETCSSGGIILPERERQRAKSGIVKDIGPGRVLLKGTWYGTRRDVYRLLGLSSETRLVGKRVHWEGMEEVVRLSQPRGQALVRAGDLMAIEE
jgi:co-chaperonin GroES (HSP10)